MAIIKVELQEFSQFVPNCIFATSCIHKIEQNLARVEGSNKVVKNCWLVDDTGLTQRFGGASYVGIDSHQDSGIIQMGKRLGDELVGST